MREQAIILERNIRSDLKTIAEIYAQIGEPAINQDADEDTLIVLAYRLHSLYSAFENIFRQIAKAFENHLDNQAGWRVQLLQRMKLDLMPIRPAAIDEDAYDKLDELRRFRHLFRSAYSIRLDARRLQLTLDKAIELRDLYPQQTADFLKFIQSLQ
ncbi:MAG: hypothetical protein ACE5FD_01075 [Anaerolineae bacterium]